MVQVRSNFRPASRIGPDGELLIRVTLSPILDDEGRIEIITLQVGTEIAKLKQDAARRFYAALGQALRAWETGKVIK